MKTDDIFNPKPMSVYDSASQPKAKLNNISGVTLDSLQSRIAPRNVGTGANRGEMTIRGLIRVVDTDGNVRIILGYKQDSF